VAATEKKTEAPSSPKPTTTTLSNQKIDSSLKKALKEILESLKK
jgi:hypothetical protein